MAARILRLNFKRMLRRVRAPGALHVLTVDSRQSAQRIFRFPAEGKEAVAAVGAGVDGGDVVMVVMVVDVT